MHRLLNNVEITKPGSFPVFFHSHKVHLFSFRSFLQTTLTDIPSLNIIDLHSQVNCLPFIFLNPENTVSHLGGASLSRAL